MRFFRTMMADHDGTLAILSRCNDTAIDTDTGTDTDTDPVIDIDIDTDMAEATGCTGCRRGSGGEPRGVGGGGHGVYRGRVIECRPD